MLDSIDFKKFLYSQQTYTALRMTLGTVLPGVVLMLMFDEPVAGISCALGAVCTSLVDVPAPLWRKQRHMLIGTLVVAIVSLLSLMALPYPWALWVVVLTVCFIAGLTVAYGTLPTAMGLTAMMAVVMLLAEHSAGVDLSLYLTWIIVGGLWYTYFCLAVCRLFQYQIARRSLAECLYATADYLNARSQFYMPAIPLDQCHRTAIAAQVAVIDAQQAARDLVLTNLFVRQKIVSEPQRLRLLNILTDVIDLHGSVLAMHVDFEALRVQLAHTDALDFMRDMLTKTARELIRVAEGVIHGTPMSHRFNIKAELRALEYETQLASDTAAQAMLKAAYSRGRIIATVMEKLIDDLQSSTNTTQVSLEVIEKNYYQAVSKPLSWRLLSWTSPAFRFGLRLMLAIALGMAISDYIGGHSIWIVITIMVVMRPNFGLTQERNKHRLFGTLLGCLAIPLILWLTSHAAVLFWIMAVSFLLCFALVRVSYLATVFFTTIALLLLYHFMAPDITLVGQRMLDTLIGALIGAGASYFFPTWEYQLLAPHIKAVLKNCREFAKHTFASEWNGVEYRLARRDALVALTTLAAAHQRLLQDPVKQQVHAKEVADLVLQGDILVSDLASLAQERVEHSDISESPQFNATAKAVDQIFSGQKVQLLTEQTEFAAIQQSALAMMTICSQLSEDR